MCDIVWISPQSHSSLSVKPHFLWHTLQWPWPVRNRMMLSDVCLSVCRVHRAQIEKERPRKTKIGTEVAHIIVTRTPLSRSKGQGHRGRGILWRPPAQLVSDDLYLSPLVSNGSLGGLQWIRLKLKWSCVKSRLVSGYTTIVFQESKPSVFFFATTLKIVHKFPPDLACSYGI